MLVGPLLQRAGARAERSKNSIMTRLTQYYFCQWYGYAIPLTKVYCALSGEKKSESAFTCLIHIRQKMRPCVYTHGDKTISKNA